MKKIRAKLENVKVGDGLPVVIMGVINLSPDSFYRGSVVNGSAGVVRRANEMVEEGANLIDLGAMGTGPHSKSISAKAEIERLVPAIKALAREMDAPISADTQRAEVAEAAIDAGASVINDISGLKSDPRMAGVLAESGCSAILMSTHHLPGDAYEIPGIKASLRGSLKICLKNEIKLNKVVLDPAIGHWPGRLKLLGAKALERFPGKPYTYAAHFDLSILANLSDFRELGQPICVGLSRKSFIGSVLDVREPSGRLAGTIAASAIEVLNGAHVLRTHDPAESLQAARIAEAVRDAV